jgi:hypothetical protein
MASVMFGQANLRGLRLKGFHPSQREMDLAIEFLLIQSLYGRGFRRCSRFVDVTSHVLCDAALPKSNIQQNPIFYLEPHRIRNTYLLV